MKTKTKSKKYWIAVNTKGQIMRNLDGVPALLPTKKGLVHPIRATLTWEVEVKK